jgi:hypothetical protein
LAFRAGHVRLRVVSLPNPKTFPLASRALAVLAIAVLLLCGCRTTAAGPAAVPRSAEEALERGLDRSFLLQNGALAEPWGGLSEFEEAGRLAPGWWPVERARQEDQRRREGSLAVYGAALERLQAANSGALEAYLCGRLEGQGGRGLFERARELAPRSFWPQHGLAQLEYDRNRVATAAGIEREALSCATSAFERVLAHETLVLCAEREGGIGAALVACAQGEKELAHALPTQRARLEARRAALLLRSESAAARDDGWRLARDLLIGERIAARDVPALFVAAWSAPERNAERENALRLIHARWPPSLRAALLLPTESPRLLMREARARAFEALRPSEALESFLAELPAEVRATCTNGFEALAAARRFEARTSDSERRDAAEQLALALLRLGWHHEALRFALALRLEWSEGAALLEQRARAALALDADAVASFERLDDGVFGELVVESRLVLSEGAELQRVPHRSPPQRVEDVLGSLSTAAQAWWPALHLESERPDPGASPWISFGPLGALVHPGPWFDALDERARRGRAGHAVDGLARLAANVGRFALLGHALGVGADGCWMARIGVDRRTGTQFGVPWSGTLVWCDGALAGIRPARMGASIAGLAIHQGYWVDLEVLRMEAQRIARLEAPEQLARALRSEWPRELPRRGLYARTRVSGAGQPGAATLSAAPWLSEGRRVRLALLRERLQAGRSAPLIGFDELVLATALHEEAHLCDRTRLWPPWQHPGTALKFLARSGLSASGIQRRLEYRAELSALCLVAEPRIVLAGLLELAEGARAAPTEHAHAYDALARDLVDELERVLANTPEELPEIDGSAEPRWQLHRLTPAHLRRLAQSLARAEGLVRELRSEP